MTQEELDAMYAAWLSVVPRMKCDFDSFLEMTKSFEILPVIVKGECAGAILMDGPEIHACILPKFFKNWLTPGLWRKIFVDRKSQYGYLQTRGNTQRGKQFIERCGFKPFRDVYRYY